MNRTRFLRLAIAAVALLVAVPWLVDVYTDWLWFGETGYQSVFLRSLAAQSTLASTVLALVFAWLALNLRPAVRMTAPRRFVIMTQEGPRSVAVEARSLRQLGLAAALFAVLAFGAWLRIPALLTGPSGILYGASYVDVHARLPALRILLVVAVAAVVLSIVEALRGRLRYLLVAGA